jgi:rod shape-determining protein MreC
MTLNLWLRIRDWVLLTGLLVLSTVVMLARNEPLLRGARGLALETTARVEGAFAFVGRYVRALDENTRLREENIRLSSELARAREALLENRRLTGLLALRDSLAYELLPARIISKDLTRQQNYFTLDVGTNHHVKVGMAVVDAAGILGRVVLVTPRYSQVMSYLNTEFFVPAKVQPSQAQGLIRWNGERTDRLQLEHVVKTDSVASGQLVVTSGYSMYFPPGFPIGRIDAVTVRPGKVELQVEVTPLSLLSQAEHAFVVLFTPDPEREALSTDLPLLTPALPTTDTTRGDPE